MSLRPTIESTEDLELYLTYSRPAGRYARFAEIRRRLAGVAPFFDFTSAMTDKNVQVISVRENAAVRGMAVLSDGQMRLYYADDAQVTRALMLSVDEVLHGQPAPNS